jgi:hypothetical protein
MGTNTKRLCSITNDADLDRALDLNHSVDYGSELDIDNTVDPDTEHDYTNFFSDSSDLLSSLTSYGMKRPAPSFDDVRVSTPAFWSQLKSGAIQKIVSDILE